MKTSIKWIGNLACILSLFSCSHEEKLSDLIATGQYSPPLTSFASKCDSLKKELIVRGLVWVDGYEDLLENNYIFTTTPPEAGKFFPCTNLVITIQPDSTSLEYDVAPNYPAPFFFYYINGSTGSMRVVAMNPNKQWAGKRANFMDKVFINEDLN